MSTNVQELIELESKYAQKFAVNYELSRNVVSFQANKKEPFFSWFKYREGFSSKLVRYLLEDSGLTSGTLFDPFAGSGATLFVGARLSFDAIGIELLPVGVLAMKVRLGPKPNGYIDRMRDSPWMRCADLNPYPHIRITLGAFPADTEDAIARYRAWSSELDAEFKLFCDFIAISVLEDVSYTRKDGQYLRWDQRAGKNNSQFDKGEIGGFNEAVARKLSEISLDLIFGEAPPTDHRVKIMQGSTFAHMESMPDSIVDVIVTSPPYCNRYDYTRTYALELAYLDVDDTKIKCLRQSLLTCTVENKPKDFAQVRSETIEKAQAAIRGCHAYTEVIEFLHNEVAADRLNNKGIVRMVDGYFSEMALHIAQSARVMKPGGVYYMVNDNVCYNGRAIPVDCILSHVAEDLGFICECIWTLDKPKGNSSQQMARHGKTALRKCVYKWRRVD